ncbi:MAG: VOC family protein [Acidobacteriota bacterium]|nr:VOC family protein [Acidobacteriota bacterium]
MIQGLHHTSFTVSNVAEAERFFIEIFGMKRIGGGRYDFDYIRRQVGYPDAVLHISVLSFPTTEGLHVGAHLLELIEYQTPRQTAVDTSTCRPGAAHMAFVVDDIHAEFDRLQSKGIQFKSSPNEVTFGINRGAWAVYFNGPDMIALELIQPARPGTETKK